LQSAALTANLLRKTSRKRRRGAKNNRQHCMHLEYLLVPSVYHNPKSLGVFSQRRTVLAWIASIPNPNLESISRTKHLAYHWTSQIAPADMAFESIGIGNPINPKRLLKSLASSHPSYIRAPECRLPSTRRLTWLESMHYFTGRLYNHLVYYQ